MKQPRLAIAVALLLVVGTTTAQAVEGVATARSSQPFSETLERLEATAKEKGLTVFARLDHAAAATSVGQQMPPSTVLVVGNPRAGTALFLRAPTLAIDLPLKVLVWQDAQGTVFVTYNSAPHMLMLSQRHGLPTDDAAREQAERTQALLAALAATATQ